MFAVDTLLVTAFLWSLTTTYRCQPEGCTALPHPTPLVWVMATEPQPMATCLAEAFQRNAQTQRAQDELRLTLQARATATADPGTYETQHYVCLPQGARPLTQFSATEQER
jgi:hypothetical protein